ncbi:A/G-specific adenine glycosylase [Thermodesulfobacteriota bacterium B35]
MKNIPGFCHDLLAWFSLNRRPLPWRRDYQPYHVWIAEIMGQQTQMERVVDYFNRWLALFPDITVLASASELQVLKAWEGLGYYSRARNILRAAALIVERHHGKIPSEYEELLALPGIGPYTAAAIMSIAYNRPFPVLDANVQRVLARLMSLDLPLRSAGAQRLLRAEVARLMVEENPRMFNQAMMELGALVCKPRHPSCGQCPVREHCRALADDVVSERPLPQPRREKIRITMACVILCHRGRIYIQKRLADDVWGGLWEFPGGRLKSGESPARAARRELLEETSFRAGALRPFRTVSHCYTRYHVVLHAFFSRLDQDSAVPVLTAATSYRWINLDGLDAFPFPAGHRQLVRLLKKNRKNG